MDPIRQIEKRYCSLAMFVAIVGGAILILCGFPSLGKGLILGCLFSIINFVALGGTLPPRIGKTKRQVFAIALGSLLLRMLLLAAPMAIALKSEKFHFITTMIGLFLVQLTILADYTFRSIKTGLQRKLSGDING
jgi:uncharacterized membrane protein